MHVIAVLLIAFANMFTIAYADELFIPANMILSESYHGVFVRQDDSSSALVYLATDSDIVKLPENVYIPAGKNHASFDISLYGTGDATVIAQYGNAFFNSTVKIYNAVNSDYNILLVFPQKTTTSKINGALYFVDDLLNPVYASDDTVVHLVGTGLDVDDSVTVKKGQSSAFFPVNVHGDSTLSAYTNESTSNTIRISYDSMKFNVNMDVAPDVIAPNSFGYVFVWLTDESGNILHHPPIIRSTLQVSGNNVLSVDGVSLQQKDMFIQDGFFYQKIYSHQLGNSTVTVNVPGYGAAGKNISVQNPIPAISSDTKPNSMKTQIFPPSTDSHAYLVISMFSQANYTYPAYGVELSEFSVTSQNLLHDSAVEFLSDGRKSQSMIIPLTGKITGNHTVYVSTPGMPTVTAGVQIMPPVEYTLSFTPLPFVSGVSATGSRPLFALSVLDQNGAVLDPHYTFGDLQIQLLSKEASFESGSSLKEPVTILYGKSEIRHPTVTAVSKNSNIAATSQSVPNQSLVISIQMPNSAHSGEPFPAYAQLLADGKPISEIDSYLKSDCPFEDSLFKCVKPSKFVVFNKDVGFASKAIDIFENTFEQNDFAADFGPDELHIGEKRVIKFNLAAGVTFTVSSAIPFETSDNSVTLKPDRSGKYDLSVVFSKQGYKTQIQSHSFVVSEKIQVDLNTVNSDGVSVGSTVIANTESVNTPGFFLSGYGVIHLEFPQTIITGLSGFVFEGITTSDGQRYKSNIADIPISGPVSITAVYKNTIFVTAKGGTGGGAFEKGDTITLDAPPRDVVSFLVRDTFDHWSYLPQGYDVYLQTVKITAEKSFDTTVVYRQDYSGIVLVFVFAVVSLFVFMKRDRISVILAKRK